jgi:osmotically-inducible protein OsmY
MKKHIVCISIILANVSFAMADGSDKLAEIGAKVADETRRLAKISEIKARLIDNKEVKARYIRVQYDGSKLQLAGFVPSTNVIATIEQIGRMATPQKEFESYWQVAEGLIDHDPHTTVMSEQASDAAVWLKVKAALYSPNVLPLLKGIHVQALDVRSGNVTVYMIADAPPGEFDPGPHIKNIAGVKSSSTFTIKAFPKTP